MYDRTKTFSRQFGVNLFIPAVISSLLNPQFSILIVNLDFVSNNYNNVPVKLMIGDSVEKEKNGQRSRHGRLQQ